MAQSVDPTQPRETCLIIGTSIPSNDEDSVRGPHQGQQSLRTASTGRTHDCKRPVCCTLKDLLPGGSAPFTAMQHPRQNAGKPLAQGLRMVKMGTLSCGAPGTRPRGVQ